MASYLRRVRIVLAIIALLLVACKKEQPPPAPKSELDERDGIAYQHGSDTPFSGSINRKFPNGELSAETIYTNGLKLTQRSWHTNGALSTEYLFYKGELVVRGHWDVSGEPIGRKQDKIAALQAQRGFDLVEQEKFVEGYVWIHFAATNGQPVALQALGQFPPKMTEAQKAEAKAIAEGVLGTGGN